MNQLISGIAVSILVMCSIQANAGALTMTRPIDGGRWGDQAPGDHPVYMYQRSVDVYVPLNSGTVHPVRLSSYTHHYYDDGFYFEVDWKGPTCSSGGDAGTTIKFIIYNSSGQEVGKVAYSHLDRVPSWIKDGVVINWWSVPFIGYTKRWNNGACWSVDGDNATHVHMEWEGTQYGISEYVYQIFQTINWGIVTYSRYN